MNFRKKRKSKSKNEFKREKKKVILSFMNKKSFLKEKNNRYKELGLIENF